MIIMSSIKPINIISIQEQREFIEKYYRLCKSYGLYVGDEDLHIIPNNEDFFVNHINFLKTRIR